MNSKDKRDKDKRLIRFSARMEGKDRGPVNDQVSPKKIARQEIQRSFLEVREECLGLIDGSTISTCDDELLLFSEPESDFHENVNHPCKQKYLMTKEKLRKIWHKIRQSQNDEVQKIAREIYMELKTENISLNPNNEMRKRRLNLQKFLWEREEKLKKIKSTAEDLERRETDFE